MTGDMEDPTLNVAAWQETSLVSGPGSRFLLWLQGCPFRCRGCINEDFLAFTPKRLIGTAELAETILANPKIEGVTYSGGEPMAQAAALLALTLRLRGHGLSVVCYSGYTLEELRLLRDRDVEALLDSIDILIDGRFEQSQRENLPWRGSQNQKVHFLTPRYSDLKVRMEDRVAEVELVVGNAGITATGILNRRLLRQLNLVMKESAR